ncbi:uracil phosphoribosyltransferase-domain-containing protein [Durotheca rogersii]|uniref:uracil phosphoribosyltransferase-domain-containing protein n=1 Tax=Durotheca rogersii TaxID=419775 RepID=UPI00221FFE25|nr:uracil phosphoribosyltransferase-domain-containing protein [Durotheca rogersii]KAI5864693.1 uracil phosphoribosyltransferase-domain-containing protein [Durotheca rogersii]
MPPSADLPNGSVPVDSQSPPSSTPKPVIVGLYGVPGCGKSYLLAQLKKELDTCLFEFYEGSEVISSLTPGGLVAFQKATEQEKLRWRQLAIDSIAEGCAATGRVGVVAGHFMFWNEGDTTGEMVYTQNDMERYTHILYLNINPDVVWRRRSGDTKRSRSRVSVGHLHRWQEAEKLRLRQLCRDNGILFSLVSSESGLLHTVAALLHDIQCHTEQLNLSRVISKLDGILAGANRPLHTMLVLDGDKTLAAEDTGSLFWKIASEIYPTTTEDEALKRLFSSRLGYSYSGFRQAALLYEETFSEEEFDLVCEKVASAVTLRSEFASLLRAVEEQNQVCAVVVTCGLGRVWDKILARAGLAGVKVIGGGRVADGCVVTPEVKASLIRHLQVAYKLCVWAFGDSPLDVPMLSQADKAVVVVGEEGSRSKSMDAALLEAVSRGGLQARQMLVPNNVPPRLDIDKLPLIDLSVPEFIRSIVSDGHGKSSPGLRFDHATTRRSAQLLMTPMRDGTISGPRLRKSHQDVGWYLATEFLTEVIGIEEYPIRHVQGNTTSGYRLRSEQKTLIVPLMRGGEAMALGVNEAFPLARFVHASRPHDIGHQHVQDISNIILVDSVINSGKSIVEFARHVRGLCPTARIVAVAGVVQNRSVSRGGLVYEYACEAGLELVALRISDNKFTGSGGTDTGNRLYNTTHLL